MTTKTIDSKEYEIVSPDSVLLIDESIAVCPYCGKRLYVQFEEWEDLENGYWQVSDCGAVIDCESEPGIEGEEYDYWLRQHTYMPYVYMLPIHRRVTEWLQEKYRIMP